MVSSRSWHVARTPSLHFPGTFPPLPWAGMKMMKISTSLVRNEDDQDLRDFNANEDDGHFIVWAGLHEDESDGRLSHTYVRL